MAILSIREEIICILVLIFLICYKLIYKGNSSDSAFIRVAVYALLHVLFDLITVITVNNLDVVPPMVNKVLHILYYYFSMLFTVAFYNYVVRLTVPHNMIKRMRIIGYIPLAVFVVLSFILPIRYIAGRGTCYSYEPLVFAGYGIFMIYCITCMTLAIIKRNSLDLKVRLAVIPTTILMFIMIAVQAVIPELLMTGAGVTIMCIGLTILWVHTRNRHTGTRRPA